MKISIWQQFSSNHSSHFKIVGVFDTPKDAEKAAAEIKAILEKIQKWHQEHPQESEELGERWGSGEEWPPALSEIEKELAKQYNVKWPAGIDWFWQAQIHILLGHIVTVEPQRQTDWGPEPFEQIVNRLGGYGLVAGSDIGGKPFGKIIIRLSCKAPNIQIAEEIVREKPTDEETESIRKYERQLVFQWDYGEGAWELEELIDYLKKRQCTDIEYWFYGTHYTETAPFPVNE